MKDCTHYEALVFLLNEWTAITLAPNTLNVVCFKCDIVSILQQWWMSFKNSMSQPPAAHHMRYLNFYGCFQVIIGLVPIFPMIRVEISFMPSYSISCVVAKNCGLSGLEKDLLLTKHSIGDGRVLYKGILKNHHYSNYGTPMNSKNIKFLTHLIQGILVKDLESCVQLWEVLVDLQLTYLGIDVCCLLCSEGGTQTKKIISLHQKCLKLKALESYCSCTKCDETKQPLLLSNFPSLIHFVTSIENVTICNGLKYFQYWRNKHSWEIANCNLEQVCILSVTLVLSDSFMIALSAHGGKACLSVWNFNSYRKFSKPYNLSHLLC